MRRPGRAARAARSPPAAARGHPGPRPRCRAARAPARTRATGASGTAASAPATLSSPASKASASSASERLGRAASAPPRASTCPPSRRRRARRRPPRLRRALACSTCVARACTTSGSTERTQASSISAWLAPSGAATTSAPPSKRKAATPGIVDPADAADPVAEQLEIVVRLPAGDSAVGLAGTGHAKFANGQGRNELLRAQAVEPLVVAAVAALPAVIERRVALTARLAAHHEPDVADVAKRHRRPRSPRPACVSVYQHLFPPHGVNSTADTPSIAPIPCPVVRRRLRRPKRPELARERPALPRGAAPSIRRSSMSPTTAGAASGPCIGGHARRAGRREPGSSGRRRARAPRAAARARARRRPASSSGCA